METLHWMRPLHLQARACASQGGESAFLERGKPDDDRALRLQERRQVGVQPILTMSFAFATILAVKVAADLDRRDLVVAAMNDHVCTLIFFMRKREIRHSVRSSARADHSFWIAPEGKAAGRCRDPIPAFTIQNIAGIVIGPKRPSTDRGLLSRVRAGLSDRSRIFRFWREAF